MTYTLDFTGVHPDAVERIRPFFQSLVEGYAERLHSLHLVGSAVSGEYSTEYSDVNSVIILKKMDLDFLELIAPVGKTFGKKRVKAPLIMTPEYIRTSLDVFPIEFREMAQIHKTVYGDDALKNLKVESSDLRHQCERDLKAKLIGLRQGYLRSLGEPKVLSEEFMHAISGYAPLFRAILFLVTTESPPLDLREVLTKLEEATGIPTAGYQRVLTLKKTRPRLKAEELNGLFEDYYRTTERLSRFIDERTV